MKVSGFFYSIEEQPEKSMLKMVGQGCTNHP